MKKTVLDCGCTITYIMGGKDKDECYNVNVCWEHAKEFQKKIEDMWVEIIR